jgi:putative DNA primase/helicase
MIDAIDQFRAALTTRNIIPPGEIIADGKLHRCDADGKNGKGDAAYLLHLDGIPAGGFENHRDGLDWQSWRADMGRALSPVEEAAHRAKIESARREHESERQQAANEAAAKAKHQWEAAEPASAGHPYLTRKRLSPTGIRQSGGKLLIPMRNSDGELRSLQFIDGAGVKRFPQGAPTADLYWSVGNPVGRIVIAEGFADAATIHAATGDAAVCAFSAGNLPAVATILRRKFPDAVLIVFADNDEPGQNAAQQAAAGSGCLICSAPDGIKDASDLFVQHGANAVKAALEAASEPPILEPHLPEKNPTAGDSDSNGWPDPHHLAAKIEPEPYPLDALPDAIRAAVGEVVGFVKAPAALVASSALAALSLACQAHIDAKRAEKLHGSVGLFLLTIADSGERKSTCDGFFTRAIRDYEEAQAEAAKPALKDHKAAIEAWEAKRGGVKEKIRQLAKDNKPTAGMESALRDLEHDKPEPPRIPRLLYADATPEALAYGLAKQWPSGGVVSAEAGIVFGSHGMGKDSVMRNLGLLNQLWDGTSLTIDRRSTESFTVRGARLTVALQVQEPTLREFFTRTGALARGTGFLARFLVAWPESTQGQRPFTDPPANWPHLSAFHRRIAAILDQPAPIDEDGALTPAMLSLAPDAKAAWVEYHNAIESELSSGGELYDVRDVASKSADNAARLAALFQQFEHGMGGAIGLDSFERASRIAAWHLSEARRFFGELALPSELADAARLDSWLIEHCRQARTHVAGKNHVRQHGPLRDGARLDAAIRELAELDRLRLEKDGKRLTIHLNPALMEVAP